jgi:hypothetical protein
MMAKLEEGLTHCNPEVAVSAPVLKSRLLALRAGSAQQMSYFWSTYMAALTDWPRERCAAEHCRQRALRGRSRAQR